MIVSDKLLSNIPNEKTSLMREWVLDCGELLHLAVLWMSLMMWLPHQGRKRCIKDKFDKHSQAPEDNQKYLKVLTNWAN